MKGGVTLQTRFFARVVVALGVILAPKAYAYTNFIGYGYQSCTTCHYNPFGNGPLTDYGRAVSASVIADRPFFISKVATDEDLANASGFLGPVELPSWIRPSFGFRGMLLTRNLQQSPQTSYVQMQADGTLAFQLFDDRLTGVFTLGYIPPPSGLSAAAAASAATLISRQYSLGYRFSKEWGIYAGFMDIAYGLRTPDHIAYSRLYTFLAQNDQTHGVLIHTLQKGWEAGLHAFLGNLLQDASEQLKGVSATAEFDVGENFRPGFSVMYAKNNYRERKLASLHGRIGYGEGASIIAETGVIDQSTVTSSATLSHYLFLQSMQRLVRGMHLLFTVEYYASPAFGSSIRNFRAGPSFQYYPMQRIEFRVDLLGNRSIGNTNVNSDTFNLMSQLHIWL